MLDKSVWASYKAPLKRYIFEYDGDREYYAGKTKVMSSNWAPGYQVRTQGLSNPGLARCCSDARKGSLTPD